MKKMTLFALLLSICLMQAQEIKANDPLTFFGVDYSLTKVYGAEESAGDLVEAFDAINNLFITEYKKYNPEKAFKTSNVTMSLTMVREKIDEIDRKELKIDNNDYELSSADIQKQIRSYQTGNAEGIGAVLIGVLLDKGKHRGTYHAVTFDIKTKKVISDKIVSGQAKGFGLRNFWARSVFESMNALAKSKK